MNLTALTFFVISLLRFNLSIPIKIPLSRSYRALAPEGRQLVDNEHDVNLTSVQDVYYHGPLTVGEQTFNIIFDTGSSLTFVPHSELEDSKSPTVDCANSSTCESTSSQFDVRYGSGRVKGELVYERVVLADALLDQYKVGLATDVEFPQFSKEDYHGICGLAWPSLSADYDVLPIVLALRQAEQIPSALFAMYLTEGGGELVLGETDSDHYVGNITWLPLVQRSWWTVTLDGAQINGTVVLSNLQDVLIVDSGTSLVSGPKAKVAALLLALENQSGVAIKEDQVSSGVQYSVKCVDSAKLANVLVGLSLRGGDDSVRLFTVSAQSLVVGPISSSYCLLGVSGASEEGWILGDSWLRSFYTVYDYDNSSVGFAEAKPAQGFAAVSTSTSTPPPSAFALVFLLALLIL